MNIGISVYTIREASFLFSEDFIDYIRNDNNKYLIFSTRKDVLVKLLGDLPNVTIYNIYKGNKFKRFIYHYLLYPHYRYSLLNQQIIGDHNFIRKQDYFSDSYKPKYRKFLYYLYSYLPILEKLLRYLAFKTNFYVPHKIDEWLITQYHSYLDRLITYNERSFSFIPNSHDSLTISGIFQEKPKKIFSWQQPMKYYAKKLHCLDESSILDSGSPHLEKLRNLVPSDNSTNKILYFGSNNYIYNEVELIKELKSNNYLNELGISLRLSPSVGGVGKEWHYRKNAFIDILGEDKISEPENYWLDQGTFGINEKIIELDAAYYKALTEHNIFIIAGISNVAYDVLATKGILILMFYEKHKIENKFNWWECEEREVLDHIKGLPGVFVCRNADELEECLKHKISHGAFSDTIYKDHKKSSQIILNYITDKI